MDPRHFKPLIVVGRQRSGTRFLTDLLNSFDEVVIQGEVPPRIMEHVTAFIQAIDSYYATAASNGEARRVRHAEWWRRKKESLLFAIWENVSQGRPIRSDANTKYFGYKRPSHEKHFEFYEAAFAFRPPFYVYCIRNFVDNFLSVVSRWPERQIEDVAADYMDSVAQYHKMKNAAPNRVLLFNLDDHIRYGLEHVERNVIRPLGLKLTEEHRTKLKRMRGRNRTEDLNIPRRKVLTMSEQAFLDEHPELADAFRQLCWSET